MGINADRLLLLEQYTRDFSLPRRMIELGDQILTGTNESAKQYFQKKWDHLSIDITGEHGSVVLNLCDDITGIVPADVVTNFGTAEHVEDQYRVFRNIHAFCKTGGLMVHDVPEFGHWPGHCKYYYSIDFFKYLAAVNHYEMVYIDVTQRYDNLIFCILKKMIDQPFYANVSDFERHICSTDNPITIPEDAAWKRLVNRSV